MKKGFTLVELVIVIIIVGILSIVAVPIYKGYTDRAKESEGKALLGSINTAEKVYFAENNKFLGVTESTNTNAALSLDSRANKYYKTFTVTASASTGDSATFTAIVTSDADLQPITLTAGATGNPRITGGIAGENI